VSAFDPIRLAAITAVLALVAILAGLFPALRAASVDPIQALRPVVVKLPTIDSSCNGQ
jgi:ABC-type lipoprotein release transport system permease subunit